LWNTLRAWKIALKCEYEKENPYNIISVTMKTRYAMWLVLFASLSLIVLMSYIIHIIL